MLAEFDRCKKKIVWHIFSKYYLPDFMLHDAWFKEMYFEFASVIQLGTLRRFANFTFHENYLSSQSTFGQSYMWFLQSNKQNYPWYFYNLLR